MLAIFCQLQLLRSIISFPNTVSTAFHSYNYSVLPCVNTDISHVIFIDEQLNNGSPTLLLTPMCSVANKVYSFHVIHFNDSVVNLRLFMPTSQRLL